jgi:hypothetical protein
LGDVLQMPRELRDAQAELTRYLETVGSEPVPEPSRTASRFTSAMKTGARLHQGAAPPPAEAVTTWRISPILNELLRRKTITEPEYEAAHRFLRDCYLGMQESAGGSSYAERGSASAKSADDRETRRVHHKREFMKAFQALDPVFHPALAWLIGTLTSGMPLAALGSYRASHLGTQTQSARGGEMLSMTCLFLCRHYGIKHPLDVIEDLSKLSAMLESYKQAQIGAS